MEKLIKLAYDHPLISRLFHTLAYCVKRELADCETVLDLGCGQDSLVKNSKLKYSLGVEVYPPYLEQSRGKKIHSDYLLADITKVDFPPKSFDAVLLIDVLEHLEKNQGKGMLEKAERWARKKVVISTPNGFLPQKRIDDNPGQKHLSGWEVEELTNRGYKVYGMAGLKLLRSENTSQKVVQEGDIFSTIRFRPKLLWLFISELTQLLTYYFPKLAFEVLYVKKT